MIGVDLGKRSFQLRCVRGDGSAVFNVNGHPIMPLPGVQKRSRRGAVFLSGKAPEGFREGSKREVFFRGRRGGNVLGGDRLAAGPGASPVDKIGIGRLCNADFLRTRKGLQSPHPVRKPSATVF